mmetsp:Transcript_18897/g.56084  ORF Transcript_18897/g.56084 Transcript_18897/m.56084 type:complete len:248 (-) Transcript_18897:587-1330(-)
MAVSRSNILTRRSSQHVAKEEAAGPGWTRTPVIACCWVTSWSRVFDTRVPTDPFAAEITIAWPSAEQVATVRPDEDTSHSVTRFECPAFCHSNLKREMPSTCSCARRLPSTAPVAIRRRPPGLSAVKRTVNTAWLTRHAIPIFSIARSQMKTAPPCTVLPHATATSAPSAEYCASCKESATPDVSFSPGTIRRLSSHRVRLVARSNSHAKGTPSYVTTTCSPAREMATDLTALTSRRRTRSELTSVE